MCSGVLRFILFGISVIVSMVVRLEPIVLFILFKILFVLVLYLGMKMFRILFSFLSFSFLSNSHRFESLQQLMIEGEKTFK